MPKFLFIRILMVAFTRLCLFIFIYFTIFFISAAVEQKINNFQGFSFLFISILLLIRIYFYHQDKSTTKDSKEMLYTINFLCIFTSLGSFLGIN